MVGVVYLLAFLMVSNIPYPAFKKFENRRVTFTRFLFVILFLYVCATIPRIALFVLSLVYTLSGPILSVALIFKGKNETETQNSSSYK